MLMMMAVLVGVGVLVVVRMMLVRLGCERILYAPIEPLHVVIVVIVIGVKQHVEVAAHKRANLLA